MNAVLEGIVYVVGDSYTFTNRNTSTTVERRVTGVSAPNTSVKIEALGWIVPTYRFWVPIEYLVSIS